FSRSRARGERVALAERELGFDVLVPQFEQELAFDDALAVDDGQARDLAARGRRQPGAATRVDGTRARVRDGGRDGTAIDGDERHCDGLWSCEIPADSERNDGEHRDDDDALHGPIRQERRAASLADRRGGAYQVRTGPVSMCTKFDSA